MNTWNDVRKAVETGDSLSRVPEGWELIPVVGVSFVPGYPGNILELSKTVNLASSERVFVSLVRNPDNPYDSNAIEVRLDNKMLGHIPKEIAARIAPTMDNGAFYTATVFQVRISPENPRNPGLDIVIRSSLA